MSSLRCEMRRDAAERAAATAGLAVDRGDVARAVAEDGHGLLAERGEHQFAFLRRRAAAAPSAGR